MTGLFAPAVSGFALGGSLIVAIGAQNAFLLRMGLMQSHVFILCLICALCDALLIILGVAGVGAIVDANPVMLKVVSLGGAAFLFAYALFALRRAMKPEVLEAAEKAAMPMGKAIATCLALTFLNPHVYLDTVVLVGGLAAKYEGWLRVAFGAGAVVASFVWFFTLGYGARLLQPLFAKPRAWQVLDLLIAAIMAWLGFSLLMQFLG